MESRKLELIAFSALFIALSVLMLLVFQPFLSILVLAAVLSVLAHPLYKRFMHMFRGSKNFSALLLVVIALFFLIIPVLFFGYEILRQAQNFFFLTQAGQGHYILALQDNINFFVRQVVPSFSFSVADVGSKALTFISNNLGGLLSQTTYIFFQTFLLLFAFYFFLRDGEKMLEYIVSLSPFGEKQNDEIISSVNRTITSVIRGTLFVGLIRFVLLAIAFYILGIPNALLWAGIGGIIGAVPGLGTLFVIIPASLYLLFYSNIFLAIGMGLVGVLMVFFIDNLLSAYFFGKGLTVPSLFILFSILGGILIFGPLGFIFGPIILSLFVSVVDMYKILLPKRS